MLKVGIRIFIYLFFVVSICFGSLCCLWLHLHALFCPPERCDDASLLCVVNINEKSELVSIFFSTVYGSRAGLPQHIQMLVKCDSCVLLMAYRRCKQTYILKRAAVSVEPYLISSLSLHLYQHVLTKAL